MRAVVEDLDALQRAHGRLGGAIPGAKRPKIVLADQLLGGLAHRVQVEFAAGLPDSLAQQRMLEAMIPDIVVINLSAGRVARVKTRRGNIPEDHADIVVGQRVEPAHEVPGRQILVEIVGDMGHLPERVDAGIGAACALDFDLIGAAIEHAHRRFGQLALDRARIGLDLPAVVGAAVIGDENAKPDLLIPAHETCTAVGFRRSLPGRRGHQYSKAMPKTHISSLRLKLSALPKSSSWRMLYSAKR